MKTSVCVFVMPKTYRFIEFISIRVIMQNFMDRVLRWRLVNCVTVILNSFAKISVPQTFV